MAAASHQRTGYLPVTMASFELTEKSGFYKQNPGTDVSVNQMIRKTTDKSRGVRLGNFVQIRTIIDEELEGVWSGKKTGQGRRWTTPSSAATSSSSASRRPTRADGLVRLRRQPMLAGDAAAVLTDATPALPAKRGGPQRQVLPWRWKNASFSRPGGCPGC